MFKTVMIVSALLSGVLTAVAVSEYRVYPADWLLTVSITLGTVFYHFAMRLFVGAAWSPFEHRVDPYAAWYRQKAWEAPFYKRLRVKRWKGYLPTYNPATFDLSKHTLVEILCATCHSERVHETIAVLSFVPLFGMIPFGSPLAFILTSLFAALFDLLFVIIQRYNRPRLITLIKRQERRRHV